MKKVILIIAALAFATACKNDTKEAGQEQSTSSSKDERSESTLNYPDELQKVFAAHGGLAQWNKMHTLEYSIPKSDENVEYQTIDLKDRYTFIENEDLFMGYDGEDVWIKEGATEYKGNAGFYHNLMFYFYAMPFVLADEGLNYEKTETLNYKETLYPGIKISFNDGVGASPEDEYYLYYDSQTKKMAWLGYTVTYQTGQSSDKVNLIKYAEWQETNGLLLPKTIAWYNYEAGSIGDKRNEVSFNKVSITEDKMDTEAFRMPEGARVFEDSEE
ncbi:DUF6503 family protein [Gramella sp. MAR_2010_147]|uniref:DUF6503 family protein n=1 Tax=Gramella sp. MAR_2010_147 TaxID=1250205 RepID=UPI00087C819F|nr:DUF6503 family protein [Gramella sp. MAR_2010_147]SDR95466.1 hypothetical protein SAMN04488553_1118 [Gramella sp. MAR_2010_147]